MQSNLENKIHDEILRACQPEMDLLLESMQTTIVNIGIMNYGDVIQTETFGELKKIAKVIVHMFAPQVIGSRCTNEDKLALTACFSKALDIMREKDFTSISFPCGTLLYPRGEAAKIIVESLLSWISQNEDNLPKLLKIFLVFPSRNDELLYKDSLEKAKRQLRISASHSIRQENHNENICDNAHSENLNIPHALLDNVIGDGDCLFRSIIRALHGGSEQQDLQNDQQQILRRLIARSYQRDIARATDEEVAILVNEVEWNAEHIQRAGLLLDELNPRASLRRYSIHMMQSSNYDDTRWGSHLEVRYAENVLNRNIMIVENRRELLGNVWRELDGVYEAIFLGNNEINIADLGLARFTEYSQIFDVLRQINMLDVIVLRRSGSHYRPIYMHPMDEQQRQRNLNLLVSILQDVPDEPWNE
uniref:OTU domain-containing protein n=1 Tax=Meloidogyne floridensis TaxID=298350 RepID=A0A915PB44_9BILA